LRARTSEIEQLARHFAARAAAKARRVAPEFGTDALAALCAHAWPGNVRELRNVVERAVLLAGDGPITREHLPDEVLASRAANAPPGVGAGSESAEKVLRREVGAFERDRIIEALARCGGNQTRAAELLGVSRRTLVTKLKLYDIPRR
jgi:DNA-binding NtrC family response regulator